MKILIVMVALFLLLLAATPFAWSLRQRSFDSRQPKLHLITDMDKQSRLQTQALNTFFVDQRAMRPAIVGTIAREDPMEDDHRLRGLKDNEWSTDFPMPLDLTMLERGRLMYGIHCAPCHGYAGHGDGMISARAVELDEGTWTLPTSLHTDAVRELPVGAIFNTITRGVRNMPGYGHQISVEDRWAVVGYVRALQRSQNALSEDIPESQRAALLANGEVTLP